MWFGLLVEVPLCEIGGRVLGAGRHVVWGRVLGGMWFGALVEVALCEIGGRVLGACSLGCWWMLFCELDGQVLGAVWGAGGCCFASLTVLGGIQLALLVEVPLCEIGGLGCWCMLFCELDGVLGGIQLGLLAEVPLCEIGGRVLGGMEFGVLVDAVLRA